MTQEQPTQAVVPAAEGAEKPAPMKWEDSGLPAETIGMARALAASGFFKNITNVAQAIVKIELGRTMDLTPAEALQGLYIFNTGSGQYERTNIQLAYWLIAAKIQQSGKYRYNRVTEADDPRVCEIECYRILADGREQLLGTSRFTIERADAAGLLTKDTWKNYPSVMLFARAISHLAKQFCPEVLGGAQPYVEEPYIDATARTVSEAEPILVEDDPDGYTPHWRRFWAYAKGAPPAGRGLTEENVHQFFGVPNVKGALKAAVLEMMESEGRTEASVVASMEAELRSTQTGIRGPAAVVVDEPPAEVIPPDPEPPEMPTVEEEREEAAAATAAEPDPPDDGAVWDPDDADVAAADETAFTITTVSSDAEGNQTVLTEPLDPDRAQLYLIGGKAWPRSDPHVNLCIALSLPNTKPDALERHWIAEGGTYKSAQVALAEVLRLQTVGGGKRPLSVVAGEYDAFARLKAGK